MAFHRNLRSFGPEHRLAWALLLLRACEKTGLYPVELRTFHRLMYFGNCLSQVYETKPPNDLVMKQQWGPYYPRAQFDVDQLVLMGLVDVSRMTWETTPTGTWKQARFEVTSRGFALSGDTIGASQWFAEAESFLVDLCCAYAALDDEKTEAASNSDLTYAQAGYLAGAVISFTDAHKNLSARGAKAFADTAPSVAIPSRQQQLRLYMKFLEGKAA